MSLPRLPILSAVFALFVVGLTANDAAAQREYAVAPAPAWTTLLDANATTPAPKEAGGGFFYRVLDRQVHIEGDTQHAFTRMVIEVLNQQGITEASRLSVSFDPDYQRLILHEAVVRRGGERRQGLVPDNIQVLHREEGLEWQIYDGRKTVNVILDDLRVGDVVEYSYSVQGVNPIYGGRFGDTFRTQYSFPVGADRYRLLWPADRQLYIESRGDVPEPVVAASGAAREYVWLQEDVAAVIADDNTPAWYDPYAWVQLSEWESWADVVEWALPMYAPVPRAVEAVAADLTEPGASVEKRLLSALRFTQDDVRYLGFEMGRGSHEPRSPAEVLRTRFGDCKDKSRLLTSLLAATGIEAYPALVHSSWGKALPDWHPSPDAFNHVIVLAYVDGQKYWLDPTYSHQGGTLENLYQPDYEHALVIREGETELTTANPPRITEPDREIQATLDLTDGLFEPAHYNVRTIYHGSAADAMRGTLAWQSKPEMEKNYVNYYAEVYPSIQLVDTIAIYDDPDLNRLIVDEGYVIENLWEETDTPGRKAALIYPTEIRDYLSRPSTVIRTMPLAISHPYRMVYTQSVMFPKRWNVEPADLEIIDEAFDFTVDASYANEVMTVRYEYRSKADHVMPEHAEAHMANLDRVLDNIGHEIYSGGEDVSLTPSWALALAALFSLAAAGFFAVRVYRYDPAAPPLSVEERDPRYTGLRGWLLLVGFGIVVNVLAFPVINLALLILADAQTWSAITTPSSADYELLWAPTLILQVVMNSALGVFAVLVAVLFFRKRQSFPRVYMVFLGVSCVYFVLNDILLTYLPTTDFAESDWPGTFGTILGAAIWISYLQTSKRVESTFVERRAEVPAVPVA